MEKVFYIKDFIFNNGIDLLYDLLEKESSNFKFEIDLKLSSSRLILNFNDNFKKELLTNIFKKFVEDENIIFETRNERVYFNDQTNRFVRGKKIDIIGKSSGNDIKNIYSYKTAKELNLTQANIDDAEKEYLVRYPDSIGDLHPSKAISGNNKLTIHSNLETIRENFYNYFFKKANKEKSDKLEFDSKIHLFENGQNSFTDMLNSDKKIDYWNALVYFLGSKSRKFFNLDFFIFPNSSDLLILKKFKKELNLDNKIQFIDGKSTSSNIDFFLKIKCKKLLYF